ncbi:Hypothetical predicted protein [Olea europaea subsp. europaea]|nr:Hypothetical predicted protein [Olea europaea subsp. europaea]
MTISTNQYSHNSDREAIARVNQRKKQQDQQRHYSLGCHYTSRQQRRRWNGLCPAMLLRSLSAQRHHVCHRHLKVINVVHLQRCLLFSAVILLCTSLSQCTPEKNFHHCCGIGAQRSPKSGPEI